MSATAPHSQGGIGIRLLQAPVALEHDPRARVYIIDHVKPGATIRRAIAVSNTTTASQRVSLYAGGAQIANDTFLPGPNNAVTGWTRVNPSTVELQRGASQKAEVTIAVPSTAPSGERYAVVWAQVETPGHGIDQVNRVGIRVYLDVGPGGDPPTTFTLGPLSLAEGSGHRPVISSTVHDTGQRAVDLSGALTMKSLDGSVTAGPYKLDRNPTIPRDSSGVVSVSVPSQLPAGKWQASLKVTADTVTHTESGNLTIGPRAAVIGPTASGTSDTPYLIGGAAAVAALAAGGGVAIYRRSHRRRSAKQTTKRSGGARSRSGPTAP